MAQTPVPIVGFLSSQSPEAFGHLSEAFGEGLAELGYVDGSNVRIEYRWARGNAALLPALAEDLAARGVVNLSTASELGISLPQGILLAATEIIP
jgi:putative ABC transport system substrate-binding protein